MPRKKMGRPPRLLRRDRDHQPVTVKQLALSLPSESWKTVTWRQGTRYKLRSRFAALRVRPAHRDYWKAEPHPEEWLLIEWPKDTAEPTKYWLSTLPADTKAEGSGGARQTALDHRTGLSGTQAGTRTRSLRRERLARLSPSRHSMHCGLWVPCGRAEPFFPLSPCRQSRTISPRAAAGVPAPRLASDPSGIIRTRLPHSGPRSRAGWQPAFLTARFVDCGPDNLRRLHRHL